MNISDQAVDTFANCLAMTGIWGVGKGVMLQLNAYPIHDKGKPHNQHNYATSKGTWEKCRIFMVPPASTGSNVKNHIKQVVSENMVALAATYNLAREYEIGISNRITGVSEPVIIQAGEPKNAEVTQSQPYMACYMGMVDFAPGLDEAEARNAVDNVSNGLPFASPIVLLNSGNSFHAYSFETSEVVYVKPEDDLSVATSGAQAKLAGKMLLAGNIVDTKWLALGLIRGYNVLRLTHNVKKEIKHVVGT